MEREHTSRSEVIRQALNAYAEWSSTPVTTTS
ncbi:ribbon-helix-helix protein, CopG family [Kocuria varians]